MRPRGGNLVDRRVSENEGKRITENFKQEECPFLEITTQIAHELNNIAYGVFSPVKGFLMHNQLESVLNHGRLLDDTLWTIPIVLDISRDEIQGVTDGDMLSFGQLYGVSTPDPLTSTIPSTTIQHACA